MISTTIVKYTRLPIISWAFLARRASSRPIKAGRSSISGNTVTVTDASRPASRPRAGRQPGAPGHHRLLRGPRDSGHHHLCGGRELAGPAQPVPAPGHAAEDHLSSGRLVHRL